MSFFSWGRITRQCVDEITASLGIYILISLTCEYVALQKGLGCRWISVAN